ncbi:MAG: N-acetyl-gamma-glutamyl-phosphate reductase, partial [Candidatus Zixiibacteriota bacterium]
MKKIKISVIGSTGYAGKELVKILMNHQKVELVHLVSSSYAGKNIAEIFPEFLNKLDKKLINLNLD